MAVSVPNHFQTRNTQTGVRQINKPSDTATNGQPSLQCTQQTTSRVLQAGPDLKTGNSPRAAAESPCSSEQRLFTAVLSAQPDRSAGGRSASELLRRPASACRRLAKTNRFVPYLRAQPSNPVSASPQSATDVRADAAERPALRIPANVLNSSAGCSTRLSCDVILSCAISSERSRGSDAIAGVGARPGARRPSTQEQQRTMCPRREAPSGPKNHPELRPPATTRSHQIDKIRFTPYLRSHPAKSVSALPLDGDAVTPTAAETFGFELELQKLNLSNKSQEEISSQQSNDSDLSYGTQSLSSARTRSQHTEMMPIASTDHRVSSGSLSVPESRHWSPSRRRAIERMSCAPHLRPQNTLSPVGVGDVARQAPATSRLECLANKPNAIGSRAQALALSSLASGERGLEVSTPIVVDNASISKMQLQSPRTPRCPAQVQATAASSHGTVIGCDVYCTGKASLFSGTQNSSISWRTPVTNATDVSQRWVHVSSNQSDAVPVLRLRKLVAGHTHNDLPQPGLRVPSDDDDDQRKGVDWLLVNAPRLSAAQLQEWRQIGGAVTLPERLSLDATSDNDDEPVPPMLADILAVTSHAPLSPIPTGGDPNRTRSGCRLSPAKPPQQTAASEGGGDDSGDGADDWTQPPPLRCANTPVRRSRTDDLASAPRSDCAGAHQSVVASLAADSLAPAKKQRTELKRPAASRPQSKLARLRALCTRGAVGHVGHGNMSSAGARRKDARAAVAASATAHFAAAPEAPTPPPPPVAAALPAAPGGKKCGARDGGTEPREVAAVQRSGSLLANGGRGSRETTTETGRRGSPPNASPCGCAGAAAERQPAQANVANAVCGQQSRSGGSLGGRANPTVKSMEVPGVEKNHRSDAARKMNSCTNGSLESIPLHADCTTTTDEAYRGRSNANSDQDLVSQITTLAQCASAGSDNAAAVLTTPAERTHAASSQPKSPAYALSTAAFNSEAKSFLTMANRCHDGTLRKYELLLDAVLAFSLSGGATEAESADGEGDAVGVYHDAYKLLLYHHERAKRVERDSQGSKQMQFRTWLVLSLWTQALLCIKLYKLTKKAEIRKPSATDRLSACSLLPALDFVTCVVPTEHRGQIASGFETSRSLLLQQVYDAIQVYLQSTRYLELAHGCWEQADTLSRTMDNAGGELPSHTAIFAMVEAEVAPLSLNSTILHLTHYIRLALRILQALR